MPKKVNEGESIKTLQTSAHNLSPHNQRFTKTFSSQLPYPSRI